MSSAFKYCSAILEKMLDAIKNQNIDSVELLNKELSNELKRIDKIVVDFPSSIYIFYDLNLSENSFFDIQNKFLELLPLYEKLIKTHKAIKTEEGINKAQLKDFSVLLNEFLNKFRDISKISFSNYEKILEILMKIRKEMKRYD